MTLHWLPGLSEALFALGEATWNGLSLNEEGRRGCMWREAKGKAQQRDWAFTWPEGGTAARLGLYLA
jgi:hypothetical protein